MLRLEVSGAVRPIYESLGVKRLRRAVPMQIKSIKKHDHIQKLYGGF